MMIRKPFYLLATACIYLIGCSSDSEDVLTPPPVAGGCDTTKVTYSATITPLLTSYGCTNCHGGTAPVGNINLTSYNGVKAKVDDGRLIGAIHHQVGFRPMPEGGNKMNDCDLSKVRAWVNAGAANN
jgi:hypothetical protein